jgi:pimeloyl-ACP methyl ester carboxylesterase
VQVLLSSSYTGFGHSSLATDAEELGHLLGFLEDHLGSEAIGIVGHSTGCQDGVVYARDGARQGKLRFLVLQAPVSDREHMLSASEAAPALVAHAKGLVDGGMGEEMMPRAAMWAPITARRFLDLATKVGADDFFSSDLTDAELAERLGHLHVPTLFLFSGADEYVPPHVDAPALGRRFVDACRGKCPLPKAVVVEGANHSGKGHEAEVVREIVAFVEEAMAV